MSRKMNFGSRLARRLLGLSLLIGGVTAPASAGDQWTVTNLHSPPGAYESFAYGVCGGQQAGTTLSDMLHASLWSGSAASWVNLTPAGASSSAAFGISSGNGGAQQVVGSALVGSTNHASLWTDSAASWVDLNPAGATESEAFGVGGGQQVGYAYLPTQGTRAILWSGTAASWVNLHPSYHSVSQAFGISDDGQQQVGWADTEACLWNGSAESWVELHPAEAVYVSKAVAASGGQQVGSTFMGDSFHASLWTGSAESWVDLQPAGDYESFAYGVWCDGKSGYQVGKVTVAGKDHASLWSGTAESWIDLHAFLPTEFDSSVAQSIWRDDCFTYIAGYGHNTQTGFNEALLWTQANSAPSGGVCLGDVVNSTTFQPPSDGVVDGADLAYLLGDWGANSCSPADFVTSATFQPPPDGMVDGADLAGLLGAWGACD
jgi:hypothetical protein